MLVFIFFKTGYPSSLSITEIFALPHSLLGAHVALHPSVRWRGSERYHILLLLYLSIAIWFEFESPTQRVPDTLQPLLDDVEPPSRT